MQTTTGEAIDGAFDFGGDGVLRCYEASGSKSVYSVHVSMWIIIEPHVHFFVTWHTCMCSTVHTHQPTNHTPIDTTPHTSTGLRLPCP